MKTLLALVSGRNLPAANRSEMGRVEKCLPFKETGCERAVNVCDSFY